MSQKSLFLLGIAVVLVGTNAMIVQKEHLLRVGQAVYLQLAPVDPRSLMQGDYMRLEFAIARDLDLNTTPARGHLVLSANPRGVARRLRIHQGERLAEDEFLLRFRKKDWRVLVAADSYFFQEGQADRFALARYAEIRVTPSGDSVLVGLLDEELQPIRP
ncbi:MAG: GDYXXLXY domain-containing protein [Armatimonadetes bacterium]|nr:GDYXXLXY domain-containing protein [Armatimonadota bacterium]